MIIFQYRGLPSNRNDLAPHEACCRGCLWFFRLPKNRDVKVGWRLELDASRTRVHHVAFNVELGTMSLQADTKVRGVGGIFLILTHGRRIAEEEASWRIVVTYQCVGRILGNPRSDALPLGQKLSKVLFAKSMTSVAAVGRPGDHLLGVECRLGAIHSNTPQPSRFPRDWILTAWIGQIVMKGQPEAGTGTCGTT